MSAKKKEIHNLEQMIKSMEVLLKNKKPITLESILEKVGRRSFGPILLLLGLIMSAPVIGDIPGMPTILSIILFLVSIQLLFQRSYFWLPPWLLTRSIKKRKLKNGLSYLYTPAKYIDKIIKPRLDVFINDVSTNVIAAICVIIAIGSPTLELIPFSANFIGLVLIGFSLGIIAKDGLITLFSLLIFLTTSSLIIYFIL